MSPQTGGFPVTVDTAAPGAVSDVVVTDDQAPQVGNLSDGDTTNDATPKISGIAEPGSVVHIYVDGVENGSTTADASGNWTYTTTSLADGQHTFTARVEDTAGNLGPVNAGITVMLDTSTVTVSITSVKDDVGAVTGNIAANMVTDDARPEITGKAKAGSIVTIKDGSMVLGSITAGADGTWTFTPVTNLGDGAHSITATAKDLSGQEDTSGAFTFRVDTVAPNRPMIDYAEDQVGAVKNDLSNNGYTDDPQPILHGTAEANSIVNIYTLDGTLIGSATASSSGAWNFKPGSKLPEGKNTFYVTSTDAAGNVSDKSANFVVNTDYTSPDASKVSIDTVTDQYGNVQGPVLSGGVLDDPRPVIGGTGAEQGNVITVYTTDKDGNTRVLGSATVDANGRWTMTPSGSLYADSINRLSVVETDSVGNEAKPSGTYDVTLSNPPTSPVIDGVTDDSGSANVELNNRGVTSDTTPTLHGTAPGVAGNIVTIYNGNQIVGSTTLDASGHWTFTPQPALTDGTYDFTVTVKNTAGQESAKSPSFGIEIDATAPGAATDLTITDDVGTITGPLNNNDITDDNKPTFAGKAEPNSIVTILDNDTAIGSATVDKFGNWSWTPTTALADGAHQFTTTVTDSVGNTGAPTSPVNITVDTQAPGITLAIDGYLDDVGTNKGVITASGTSTDDTSPVLRGSWTGDLGSVEYIRIYQDGIFLGNATLDRGQHTWTLDVSGLENTKTYQFTATAVDAAGSESSPTPAFALTIDLDPPTQTVTITSYTDDVGLDTGNMGPNTSTDDRQPVLNGKIVGTALDAGDEVRIYDADSNTLLGTATVTGDSWSFELPALNDNTTYNFRAVVSDSAGNEGTTSGNFRITVDLNVVVNDQDTLDTTPIISGYTGFEIQPGEYVEVTVNGNTYSSQNGQVVVDPLNNTWYVQIPATHRLTTGTYDVQAVLYSAEGVRITNDDTTRELTISSAPRITFSSTTATSDDTGTAITIGEDGTWRILSNSTIFTQDGTSSSTLGSFSSVALSGPDRQQQSTFIDFDRDGLMDVLGADTSYANGQQSFKYNGSQYSVFQLGAYGVSGETNDANGNAYVWYGGAAGIDINGDGFVDIVYGDETPNDAEARGGYDTTFVINTNGTILGFNKSDAYVYSGSSQDGVAPANEDNPTPDREIAGVDLNNDGYVDIVYHGTSGTNETQAGGTNGSSSRLVVVTNGVNSSGKTTLTNTEIITGVWSGDQATTNRYTSLNWSDLNGDGYMDLFIGGLTTVGSGGATSTIHYNDGTGKFTTAANGVGTGASVQSLGDTVNSMTSLSVDWNGDGRMDVIEIAGMAGSTALNNASNVGLLWLNGGNNASQQVTWTSQTLLTNANLSSTYITTGALAVDLDYDNDQDLVVFRAEGGTTAYIENTSTVQDGTSITVRLLDAQGINSFYGNTVMLIDEATGKVVSSQIINAQSGVNMNNSTGLVYFYGLDANASYSVVLLANGKDYGGVGSITLNTGTNTIENVASSWSGLRAKEANNAYVLTAESDPNAMNSATAASDGSNTVGILGTGYNDTLFATAGSHIYNGGGGSTTVSGVKSWSNTVGLDIVDYKLAGNAALTIDLNRTTTQSTGFGSARFVDVEGLAGGQGNDTFTGNASNNYFEGRGGNDIFNLDVDQKGGGQDTLAYQAQAGGNSNGTGGNGSDTVHGFRVGTIEATLSADAIDVSNLLVGYSASADGAAHYINGVATIDAGETIGQFLTVAYNGKDTVVSIDRDGSGGAYSSSTLLTLADTKADLATLLANHQLILTDEGSAGIANFSALSEGMTANLWTGFNSAGEQLENITTLISTSGDDVITDNSADNVLEGGAGDDTFYLMNGGNDTLMYKVLDGMGNDSTGGNGHDVVHCFNVGNVGNVATDSDADTLNLSDLLDHSGPISFFENNGRTELDAASKGLENYLKTEVVGNDTVISIDRDGQGGQHGFTQVVTLADVQTDLVTLLQNNQITI
ncbi:Ig-like domain-containing protein [Trabulsiella odontotermitis]|uniref:Ig-like domain-containing protein n=1 Tax=Trabulsiella odontotermitis TaxID=379893 RepID=UPI003AD46647